MMVENQEPVFKAREEVVERRNNRGLAAAACFSAAPHLFIHWLPPTTPADKKAAKLWMLRHSG